ACAASRSQFAGIGLASSIALRVGRSASIPAAASDFHAALASALPAPSVPTALRRSRCLLISASAARAKLGGRPIVMATQRQAISRYLGMEPPPGVFSNDIQNRLDGIVFRQDYIRGPTISWTNFSFMGRGLAHSHSGLSQKPDRI